MKRGTAKPPVRPLAPHPMSRPSRTRHSLPRGRKLPRRRQAGEPAADGSKSRPRGRPAASGNEAREVSRRPPEGSRMLLVRCGHYPPDEFELHSNRMGRDFDFQSKKSCHRERGLRKREEERTCEDGPCENGHGDDGASARRGGRSERAVLPQAARAQSRAGLRADGALGQHDQQDRARAHLAVRPLALRPQPRPRDPRRDALQRAGRR